MDKGSLPTVSKVEPRVAGINPSHLHSAVIRYPDFPVHIQYIIGSVSAFLCLQANFISSLVIVNTLYASRFLAIEAHLIAHSALFRGINMSTKAIGDIWEAQTTRSIRRKLFHEFAVFILGSGNPLILMLFWPGWLIVGAATFALWHCYG